MNWAVVYLTGFPGRVWSTHATREEAELERDAHPDVELEVTRLTGLVLVNVGQWRHLKRAP